jgi:glycosyltransferase involved in cell wall biosynthesis
MDTLSVVLITYNEEKHIGNCLDSILSVADEIIIVDSFSNDSTMDICNKYPTRIIQNKFRDFSSQRNFAMSLATKSYLLFIDADEVLSEELIAEISKLKNVGFAKEVYTINRLTSFCDKWIKHGMWYPDKIQRLIKQGIANWTGEVHEKLYFVKPPSKGFIKGHLLHYSYDSVGQLVEKLEKYTSIQSMQMFKEKKQVTWIKIYINPVWAFFSGYFLKLGLLDGWQGLIIQYSIAFQTKRKYVKLKKLYLGQKNNI